VDEEAEDPGRDREVRELTPISRADRTRQIGANGCSDKPTLC
jgi:hypothetical protein